jgi:tetratricopeptide (TPR) repeat protein
VAGAESDDPGSDPQTLEALHDLGSSLTRQGHWDEAIPLHEYVVKKGTEVLGSDHPDVVIWQTDLATALASRGSAENWITLRDSGTVRGVMASARLLKDLQRATSIYREALPVAAEMRGSGHKYGIIILEGLADVLHRQNLGPESQANYQQMEAYATRTLDRLVRDFGPDNAQALWYLDAKAQAQINLGKFKAAEAGYSLALEVRNNTLGPIHRETLTAAFHLGRCYQIAGSPDKAKPLLQQTLEKCEKTFGEDDPLSKQVRAELTELTKAPPDK